MSNMTVKILPVPALADVSVVNVKQRSCGLGQNGQPVEFGQPLFVTG
jgi:hypothetical protein